MSLAPDGERQYWLAAIVEGCDDAIISTDLSGEVRSWNRTAERRYGYPAAEILGRPVFVLVPADGHGEMAAHLHRIAGGGSVPRHVGTRVTRGGECLQVDATVSAVLDRAGAPAGMAIIDRDRGALLEAQEAAARCRRFLADAAHQLRSPIAGAQASVESLLRGGADAGERERLFANLVRETARAGRLVASLLKMAHLDEGGTVLRRPCDLVALATEAVDRAWALAPQLDIVLRADGVAGPCDHIDPDAVAEILANLLDNARRYATGRVEVSITATEAGVEVRVADDGPGLAPGTEEQAFERFVTLDEKGGSGLGLPIARGLARAHGGELSWHDGGFVLRLAGSAPAAPTQPGSI